MVVLSIIIDTPFQNIWTLQCVWGREKNRGRQARRKKGRKELSGSPCCVRKDPQVLKQDGNGAYLGRDKITFDREIWFLRRAKHTKRLWDFLSVIVPGWHIPRLWKMSLIGRASLCRQRSCEKLSWEWNSIGTLTGKFWPDVGGSGRQKR